MRNLFLIGYRGTGKSTVAQLLAQRLGWKAVDADVLLEQRTGQTIRQIFAGEGESGFRDREANLLTDLCQGRWQVIATGGGVVLRAENRQKMRAAGRVVWLTADPLTIWQRLQADATTTERRPPLTVGGLVEIEELLQQRAPLYAACADWQVDTASATPEQVAEEIMERLQAAAE